MGCIGGGAFSFWKGYKNSPIVSVISLELVAEGSICTLSQSVWGGGGGSLGTRLALIPSIFKLLSLSLQGGRLRGSLAAVKVRAPVLGG